MQRQCQGTRCWLCLRNLGFSSWRFRSFGWYFWLQPPASPNTWESGNMKTQCVRMNNAKTRSNAETKFSAYTPVSLLYLSSHIYQVISIKSFWVFWHQHMGCVYLFKTFQNYSVCKELFCKYWNYHAIPRSCDLVKIYASCGLCSSGADFVAAALIEARQTVG
jgi:hypothetical protein